MAEEPAEKLPIDAKLLADAVIELNISRRSVGLYPNDHPITKNSLLRAFELLQKLFELRNNITLGIARDVLMVDEYVLDKRNPVFREFSLSIHRKGMAAVTFVSGLTIEELLGFHELLVSPDEIIGQAVMDLAEEKGLRHIRLVPIDMTKFSFTEGGERENEVDVDIWGYYVTGLIEGKLAGSDAEGIVLNIPPEAVAKLLNDRPSEDLNNASYDRVIATYLKRKDHAGVKTELFTRFLSLVENLDPHIKKQLLSRTFNNAVVDYSDIEHLVGGLTIRDMERLMSIINENSSLIPDSLRNIIDKVGTTTRGTSMFDIMSGGSAFVDDIEIDDSILKLFKDDNFKAFVADDYKRELSLMLKGRKKSRSGRTEEIIAACGNVLTDQKYADLQLELLEADIATREDYLLLLTRITDLVNYFVETGRYVEISEIYNTVYTHTLTGRYKDEAQGMLQYFFYSRAFIASFIASLQTWGRHNREGVFRLVKVMRRHMIDPLFEALSDASNPSIRNFLLQTLRMLGRDGVIAAVMRLNDPRWFVTRNMICIIREAGGAKDIRHIRPFIKSSNRKICIEAVRTLIHFKTPDALSCIKLHLLGSDAEMKMQMIKLAGMYRYEPAVPLLLELLDRKKLLETEVESKTAIVKALGDIGDPAAIASLEKLVKSRWIIRRSLFDTLKLEIYRSLSNYPPGSASELLRAGLESDSGEIKAICERMMSGTAG